MRALAPAVRKSAALLIPIIPLSLWYAYHYSRTGFVFGNPEFFRYNVQATMQPLRIFLTFLMRLWQVLGYFSLYLLTLATLRLPLAFTALLALVFLALLLVFLGIEGPSTGVLQAGGYVILVFAALGAYLFTSTIAVATGGPALPLGRPVIH